MVTPPVEPMVNGANVTVIVHVAPTASVVTQLSVSTKLPLATTLVMTSTSVPLFESVTVWGTLGVRGVGMANVRTAGERVTAPPLAGVVVVVVDVDGPVDDEPPQ